MRILLLFLFAAISVVAQPRSSIVYVTTSPSGACGSTDPLQYNTTNGALSGCNAGTWATISGGGSPGGTNNQIQYRIDATTFGGFTMSGDCTLVVATGVITCTSGGSVSGSGAAARGAFWSSSSALTSSGNWTYAAGSGHTLIQGANNTDAFNIKRFTDTSPTGYYFRGRNAADNADVASIGVDGAISTAAGITTGVGSGAAGYGWSTAGTAPTLLANSWTWTSDTTAPALGARYVYPTASGTGFMLATNSAGVHTISHVASTGSGNVVLAMSPTLTTPNLGTPSAAVLTNATGLPEGGLAFTDITTNNASTAKHGFAPKYPNDATKYLDGTGAYTVPAGSGGGGAGATLFSTTASTTVTATSATTLIGAVTGSTTAPVNTFAAGGVTEIVAQGFYSTPATPASLTIDLLIGGSVRITTGAVVQLASVTTGVWRLRCMVTTRTAGASGTQIANCIFEGTGSTLTPAEAAMQTSSTWTMDTTATKVIDIQATWSTATGSPTITATNVAAWIPGAPVTSVFGQTGVVGNLSGDVTTSGSSVTTIGANKVDTTKVTAPLRTKSCVVIVGDPGAASAVLANDNDTPVGCPNDTGNDWTITTVACWADAGSPTVTPILTGGSATSVLTGALTCGTAGWAAGTVQGSAPVVHTFSGAGATCSSTPCSIDVNITTAGGTAKYLVVKIVGTI